MTTRARRRGALALGLALVAAGCADDGGPPPTSAPTSTTVAFGPDLGNGVLQVGIDVDRAQAAAAELAVEDVGRVLGRPVVLDDRHADVVVGAGPPEPSVVRIAPSGRDVPSEDDGRLVFRTGAGNALLAKAVIDLVLEDGHAGATVVADGPDGLAEAIDVGLDDDPETVVLVGSGDPSGDIEDLDATSVYLVGGDLDDEAHAPEGIKAVAPGAEVGGRLREAIGSDEDLAGAAEAYDAVVIAALAAEAAGSDDPERLGAQVTGITQGGTTCLSFDECRRLLADGGDVDYDGLGGSYALDDGGRPTESVITVLEYAADGRIDPNRTEYRVVSADG